MKVAPHVHVGVVEFLTTVAYVLIFTLLWRVLAAKLHERYPHAAAAMTAAYS